MSKRRSGSAVRSRTFSDASGSVVSGPPSPTFSATTNASQVNLETGPNTIITRRDLRQSMNAYEDLIADCREYRAALSTLSGASSRFAATMERCSRLKGVDDPTAIGLQAAGGLHHLVANHWQILNATLLTGFEEPLSAELSTYKRIVSDRSAAYERLLLEKSKLIKQTEAESMNTSRRKQRDLQAFKRTLAALQTHVDDLDRLKAQHYVQILEHEAEVWNTVLDKTALAVRSSLDLFERLSAKSSDPMLEPLMQSVLDPFDAYGPTKSETEIFSILPPLAMSSSMRGPSPSPPAFVPHSSTNGAGATNGGSYSHPTGSMSHAWGDSAASSWNRPMNASPFSSTASFGNYIERDTPTRRPSSPPSTSTLRKSEPRERPSIQTVGDIPSSNTIKGADSPADSIDSMVSLRKDSRRDTIIAPRHPPPHPKVTETGSHDITVTLSQPSRESFEKKSSIQTGKRAGFSLSRFMGPSSGSSDT
ncbi:hypothetical protein FRC15_003585 [Serendipita sp. 397]|nr:hypothetical protein FRC15_003585 [Serendipita sp. 397]